MGKLIATINMTLDGFCDHTVMIADEELHEHFTEVLNNAGAVLYGRITYQLMESYWPTVVKNPTGDNTMDDFAVAIDNIPKIVFSNTLNEVGWRNARLAKKGVKEEVLELKQQLSRDIFVGSPSLIVASLRLDLIDEYQLLVHPVIAGNGLPLFKNINNGVTLKLLNTKALKSGQLVLYYEPIKN